MQWLCAIFFWCILWMWLIHLTVISSTYLFLKIDLLISIEVYTVRATIRARIPNLRKLNSLTHGTFLGQLGYLLIQPRCVFVSVVGMTWQWGCCFTRCTNTLFSNKHACEVSPHGTGFSFSWVTSSHLRQAGRMCHILAQGSHLFGW